tara:strand:+ start:295 stop:531 length:237 start_codon:yes stop_codon:yes gene_type:complete
MFFQLKDKELQIDQISDAGCVFNQYGCLTNDNVTYNARAITSVSLVTLHMSDIQEIMLKRRDIKTVIKKIISASKGKD